MIESAPETEDSKDEAEPSTESLLESLLVDDAKVVRDPATGRPKIVLDSPPDPA
jgi:hypothetical protein